MMLFACKYRHVLGRIMERGFGSAACIVSPAGPFLPNDDVTVDVDHPAYPRRQPSTPGPQLWAEIHHRPLIYAGEDAVEIAYLYGVVNRLPEGCACRMEWLRYLERHPPRLTSPAAYALWTFDAQTDVNLRLSKPGLTRAEAAGVHGWNRLFAIAAAFKRQAAQG